MQHVATFLDLRSTEFCQLIKIPSASLQEPEYQTWFLVEIYRVGGGAGINETTQFANVTMAESDDPRGVVYFAVGHRLAVATLATTKLSLQVYRRASAAHVMSVQYRTVVRKRSTIKRSCETCKYF